MTKLKRILIGTVVTIVLAFVSFCALVYILVSTDLGYQWELLPIKWEVKKIPHVDLIDAWGHEDISLEHIWAKVDIKGKGTMTFGNLTTDSFRDSDHLRLLQIGDLRLATRGFKKDGEFYAAYIDIASRGPLAELFQLGITNVQSAINNYSDLYVLLAGWPKYPYAKGFTNQLDSKYFLSVEVREDKNPRESNWWGRDVDRLNSIFSSTNVNKF